MYNCDLCDEEFDNRNVLANHVRWNHKDDGDNKKYQISCVCEICGITTTKQALSRHINKHHSTPIPKSCCPQCSAPIFSRNKFCSQSCSATYTNARKDYTTFTSGPPKGYVSESYRNNHPPKTNVTQCVICNCWFGIKSSTRPKTCSRPCKVELLSQLASTPERIETIKNNRGRHKRSYLEQSFSDCTQSGIIDGSSFQEYRA
jgi:hypothetical protein